MPRQTRKTTLRLASTPWKRKGFAASPHRYSDGIHGICTAPTEFVLCHHFTQPCQCDSSEVLRLPRTSNMDTQATWTQPKYSACHTKRLSTRYETCCNVTKWHACHERRGYTRRLKPPNVRIFAKLVIRVALAASLPTAAGISTRPPK